ncbi:hypothetical protein V501_00471 [Pseudogymnoascus sp. VKM F-4519 (FW-2642)]|nr:hypothetical protein V501_00471 [Pseudogymnoascus sp. VKM F-4519 (FW-2642)]
MQRRLVMEHKDPEFPKYNIIADNMDDVLESCELLSNIPEMEETDYNSFRAMFPINDGSFFGAAELPEVYLDLDDYMNYEVDSDLQHDTEDTLRMSYETPQHSSSSETAHCCCCNELSDMKRGIADILAELKVLQLALQHFSHDVSQVTEKLTKNDEKGGKDWGDEKDEEPGQIA